MRSSQLLYFRRRIDFQIDSIIASLWEEKTVCNEEFAVGFVAVEIVYLGTLGNHVEVEKLEGGWGSRPIYFVATIVVTDIEDWKED